MRTQNLRFVFAAALTCCLPALAGATPYFRLNLESSPGDWVGSGRSYSYDDFANWTVRTLEIPAQYLSGWEFVMVPNNSGFANMIIFDIHQEVAPTYWRQWHLEFSTNDVGKPIQPGTYAAVNTTWIARSPGIYIYGNDTPDDAGHGCDSTFGSFTVTSGPIRVDSGDINFAATFEQHCEHSDAPPLFGSIVYYSDGLPPGTPAPEAAQSVTTLLGLTGICAGMWIRARGCRKQIAPAS